jgi:hypothetical protein
MKKWEIKTLKSDETGGHQEAIKKIVKNPAFWHLNYFKNSNTSD